MTQRSPKPKAVFILAGGRSSRMGQDKAQLPIQGVPLLRRVYEVAVALSPTVAVITPWPERYQSLLPESCAWVQEPLPAEDKPPGPLVGLLRGLEWLAAEQAEVDGTETDEMAQLLWVMLLACDLPRLNSATLQAGVDQLLELPPNILALVPQSSEGWEPLCAFYRQACLPALQAFVQAGGRSFQDWLAEVDVQPWDLGDRTVLTNCNTLEDWQKENSKN